MTTKAVWMCILVAVPIALAGCAEQEAPPAPTASVTAVTLDAIPPTPAGQSAEVCWRVEGTGTVPHVALHWDDESHADESATFAAYDMGVAYPDNAAALDADGYGLPGRFCADVDVPATGTLYIVGHALGPDGGTGRISAEGTLTAASPVGEYVLTTTGVPATVEAGEEFTFTLTVVGPPGTSDHIGGHFGRNSTTTPSAAVYTQACIHQGGTLPGTFTVRCTLPEAGTWYLRGHTRTGTTNETYRHFWASENEIEAGARDGGEGTASEVGRPAIANSTAGGVTSTARSGSMVMLCWTVEGTGNVPHVAVHWDDESHADEAGRSFAAYDLGASYPGNGTAADPDGYDLEADGTRFCTQIQMPDEGNVFVVAHAIDAAGGVGKMSDELEITGTPL